MGNCCVGGSRMANQVHSPSRTSDASDEDNYVTPHQLLEARHQLTETAGLPRNMYNFVSDQAPQSLRNSYNNLYERTQSNLELTDMQHRYMTGASFINPDMRPHENLEIMQNLTSEWNDMREALQHAMSVHAETPESPERFVTTVNPSGSIRMSTLTPSPYRN